MRSCPQCGARYTDDLRFCLHDGTTLVSATTDDLAGLPTEQFTAQTIQDNDPSVFKTLPSADVPEQETRIAPPRSAPQYSFSAVEPASKMGCTMTLGKVAAALLFVAGLGLAGIIFTYKSANYTAQLEPPMSNSTTSSANSNRVILDPSLGGGTASNTMSNTTAASNSANMPVPSATHTPAAATPQPTATREVTTIAPPKTIPTPEPESTPADSDNVDAPGRIMRGGQLNGRAISLPKPPYPPAARAVRASGPVNVRVLIDDSGSVIAANAVSGHPLLRAAADAAARNARFPPLGRRGNRVTGIITYNFVP